MRYLHFILLFLSSYTLQAQTYIAEVDVKPSILKAISKQIRKMEVDCQAKNMKAVAAMYLDNCYLINSAGKKITGRENIDNHWLNMGEPIDWKMEITAISKNEDFIINSKHFKNIPVPLPDWRDLGIQLKNTIYQLGISYFNYIPAGKTKAELSVVHFLFIWQKQKNGEYKVILDSFSF
jgi:ketosteroid isomerase-like protein